ncbi:MAG: DsrE family protein [Anaerolineae bacterium]
MMAERKQFKGKKFLILLTVGLNAPAVARSAFMFASLAAAFYLDTVVYCVQEGADIMVKGAVDKEEVRPGIPTLKQRLAEAIEAGVKFQVCEITAANKGIEEEDLIPQAKLVGGAVLIDLALDCDGMLCF